MARNSITKRLREQNRAEKAEHKVAKRQERKVQQSKLPVDPAERIEPPALLRYVAILELVGPERSLEVALIRRSLGSRSNGYGEKLGRLTSTGTLLSYTVCKIGDSDSEFPSRGW